MGRKYERNEAVLSRAEELIAHMNSEVDRVEAEVRKLNVAYRAERQRRIVESGFIDRHQGLSLYCARNTTKTEKVRMAQIYWVRGLWKHNNKAAVSSRSTKAPLTRKIQHCHENGGYTKTNIRQALRYAEPWERELTWRYELEAQKLRVFLRGYNKIIDGLIWLPPFPAISEGRSEAAT